MLDLLYKLLPMILSLTLSQLIYLKLDEKYNLTNSINSILKIGQKWRPFFCVCCLMTSLLIVTTLGIYVIEISTIVYSILCGILTGTSIGITNNINIKKNA
jgi:hypothetical protein